MINKIVMSMMMFHSISQLNAQKISKLSDINTYETLFVDIVGVMHDGLNPYPDAVCAINTAKNSGKNVIFVSNNPRPSFLSLAHLNKMGIEGEIKVVTSGDYTRWYLQEHLVGKNLYHLGDGCNQDILKDITNVFVVKDIEKADIILLTQFIEERDSPDQFDDILQKIAQSNKTVFCANPDVYAVYEKTLRKCAGFFAQKIELFGGKVTYLGKPNPDFFEYVCSIHQIDSHDKDKTLMIGDTIDTDIKGAHHFGIDSLLVLSGISSNFDKDNQRENLYLPSFCMDRLI